MIKPLLQQARIKIFSKFFEMGGCSVIDINERRIFATKTLLEVDDSEQAFHHGERCESLIVDFDFDEECNVWYYKLMSFGSDKKLVCKLVRRNHFTDFYYINQQGDLTYHHTMYLNNKSDSLHVIILN